MPAPRAARAVDATVVGGHGLMQQRPQGVCRLERAARRPLQLARQPSLVVTLVEAVLPRSRVDHRHALERVLVAEGVVQDVVRILAGRIGSAHPKLRRRFELQRVHQLVRDAAHGRAYRVAPHLEHPAELGVSGRINLECEREVVPRLDEPFECVHVDQDGRRAHLLHLLGHEIRAGEASHERPRLAVALRVHVVERVGHRKLLSGEVGQVFHE